MKEKVLKVIEKHRLIEDNDNIVIGLSGGPDSMALFHVLLEIRKEICFNIFIAHVNHGVRGKESDKDERFVENLANRLDLPYYCKTVNMDEYAIEHKMSPEEAGRELRYNFFREILSKIGGGKIAVAHNKNDQTETLLMRFFRGTGLEGLKGMEYINKDIIRPLLGIERKEIEKYLSDMNIETRLDRTNFELVYNRNRIRLEVIPYIEKYYNPNIVETLWRTSQLISTDNDFLEKYATKVYNQLMKKKTDNFIILDGNSFKKEHKSIQQRIIRNCIIDIKGNLQGVTKKHISDIMTLFLKKGTGKSIDLIDNIIAKTSYENFIMEKKNKVIHKSFIYKLELEDATYIDELGYEFNAKVCPIKKIKINNKNRFIKYFDYDKVIGDLYIRNRKAGDRFVPFGMKGTKKIKDYFIDEKVAKEERDRIPLIVDYKNILWLVGYRINNLYKITSDTKNVLVIEVNRY
ncbi:tRNA lysidine(34) synthetase TilS [Schnuerera sp. xch1]|uniref:tRNA lysidine(34) synthetase TilS n=1 Tax=Schnuerera sp. xch1 TaxID=2874283 RepID=UPI001CBBEB23|nr:tRNA lysidine(34) synthetase TilS [Schnuerera sp. xch1]MBZ2174581.1 tRNA lysidine(34) synthetase TilS [Schnuerera sp. xch1]